jgi:hypothetical protein
VDGRKTAASSGSVGAKEKIAEVIHTQAFRTVIPRSKEHASAVEGIIYVQHQGIAKGGFSVYAVATRRGPQDTNTASGTKCIGAQYARLSIPLYADPATRLTVPANDGDAINRGRLERGPIRDANGVVLIGVNQIWKKRPGGTLRPSCTRGSRCASQPR